MRSEPSNSVQLTAVDRNSADSLAVVRTRAQITGLCTRRYGNSWMGFECNQLHRNYDFGYPATAMKVSCFLTLSFFCRLDPHGIVPAPQAGLRSALCANRPDEDPGVVLLADIRTVFQARGVDRITSVALIEALLGLADNFRNEWRGPHDDRPPRKLMQGELSRLLRPFGIRPKTIWPTRRRLGDMSCRGYLRSQFETAWRAYCPSADTPTQPSKIISLPRR